MGSDNEGRRSRLGLSRHYYVVCYCDNTMHGEDSLYKEKWRMEVKCMYVKVSKDGQTFQTCHSSA